MPDSGEDLGGDVTRLSGGTGQADEPRSPARSPAPVVDLRPGQARETRPLSKRQAQLQYRAFAWGRDRDSAPIRRDQAESPARVHPTPRSCPSRRARPTSRQCLARCHSTHGCARCGLVPLRGREYRESCPPLDGTHERYRTPTQQVQGGWRTRQAALQSCGCRDRCSQAPSGRLRTHLVPLTETM